MIQGGDLIDNDQSNELSQALGLLRGGAVHPGSGPHGYFGVQLAGDPDPFYYRPDLDAPQHPACFAGPSGRSPARALGARWCPVLGDHDILVAGEVAPSADTRALALGDRAVWELPLVSRSRRGLRSGRATHPTVHPPPQLVDRFLAQALAAPKVAVPADPTRREMDVAEVVARLRARLRCAVGSRRARLPP